MVTLLLFTPLLQVDVWQQSGDDTVGMNHSVCAHQLCGCLIIAVKKRLRVIRAVSYIHGHHEHGTTIL